MRNFIGNSVYSSKDKYLGEVTDQFKDGKKIIVVINEEYEAVLKEEVLNLSNKNLPSSFIRIY